MSAEKSNMTENLRMRAEGLLTQARESFLPADIADINNLHHELAVHQAELELQNEELRNTQLSLQKVRDRYVELYEHAPVGYVLLDAAGIIRHTNATWRAMLKRPDDDFRGTPFAEILMEDDARVFLSRFRSLFHNPADKQIELQIKRHNTKPFHAHITAKRSIAEGTENDTNELMIIVSDVTERKQAEIYRDTGREILQILNEPSDLQESIQRVLTTLKTRTKVDAVGMRLQEGEDFPYFAQDGFPAGFLQTENTLLERSDDGGVFRDKDGNVCLECTCGLVISGKTDPSSPLFTKGGSCWTNDSSSLLDLPSDQDPRLNPRNNCIHRGYVSVALIPVRAKDQIVGLIQLNDKRKDRFTLDTIEMLEDIAAHIGSALMRKQAEEALRSLLNRLTLLAEHLPGFVYQYQLMPDGTSVFPYASPGIETIYGLSPEDAARDAERVLAVLHPDDLAHIGASIQHSADTLTLWHDSYRVLYPDGRLLWVEGHATPIRQPDGSTLWHGYIQDITERKQAQLALEQKNQEMEQFVYNVSHDLKSPLVTVRTFAGMLRQDLQGGDQQQINDDLNYIEKATDKMQQLLDALLQFSRIGTVDAPAQYLSTDQQVQNCLGSLAGILQQQQIQVSTGKLPQQLHGDPMHFGQIWQNLIENAVKYMGDQTQPHIEIGATQQAQNIIFYVRDNGMGIAPEHSERIFNLFSQLNPNSKGSGLGLALVKKIVSIYQGRIWVESAGKDKGSCFMFTLPAAVIKETFLAAGAPGRVPTGRSRAGGSALSVN